MARLSKGLKCLVIAGGKYVGIARSPELIDGNTVVGDDPRLLRQLNVWNRAYSYHYGIDQLTWPEA